MSNDEKKFSYKMPLVFTNRIHAVLMNHCRANHIDEREILAAHHRYLGDELLKWAESIDSEALYLKAIREYDCAINVFPSQEFQQARNQVYFILSTKQLMEAYRSQQAVERFMVFEPPYVPEEMRKIAAEKGIRARIQYLMGQGKLEPEIGEELLALGSKRKVKFTN